MKRFEICDRFHVIDSKDENGVFLGCSVYLEKNGKKHSIADEGYGCVQILSVLLSIQNAILQSQIVEKSSSNEMCSSPAFVLAVEEPENHLHPKLQSLLADMFLEAYEQFGVTFIIETHSEYLIRKSQVLVAGMKFSTNIESNEKSPFRTYYIPNNGEPYSLWYRKDGNFAERFGSGFFDEADNLAFEIM